MNNCSFNQNTSAALFFFQLPLESKIIKSYSQKWNKSNSNDGEVWILMNCTKLLLYSCGHTVHLQGDISSSWSDMSNIKLGVIVEGLKVDIWLSRFCIKSEGLQASYRVEMVHSWFLSPCVAEVCTKTGNVHCGLPYNRHCHPSST